MNLAQPLGSFFSGATAGLFGEKHMRSILLHFEPGTTSVDGFACSSCDWFHVFRTSEPDGTLPRAEVDLAHTRFAEHQCEDYPKVKLTQCPDEGP